MARIHAASFERPWDEATFATLLSQPGVRAAARDGGFILIRAVADEAEILTLAVAPDARRRGVGQALVEAGAALARMQGASAMHLEVAEDNVAALGLYRRTGFAETGRRPRYYPRETGPAADALILSRNLADALPTVTG